MKLRFYIIATLAAAAALFTGCKEEGDTYFSEIRVSQSYVGIPMEGGEKEITVTAQGDWAIEIPEDCEWLSVDPMTGGAGETKVTLSANETFDGRSVEILLSCLNRVQHINIIQGLPGVSEATVKEINEGPEKQYRVTGTVTRILDPHFGNIYINDGSVEGDGVYIYGILDKKGNEMKKATAYDVLNSGHENAYELSVGDKITVEGPKVLYNGTVELKNVAIIDIVKSLVKVIPMDIELDGPEAGDTLIKIATIAPSIKVKPNVDWLYVKEIEQKKDTVYARIGFFANEGVTKREGTISVTGEGFKDITVTITQGANAPDLMTIAEALQRSYVHVKGTIMAICNQGYILSDATGSLLVFYGSTFDATQFKLGDEMEIIGDLAAYNFGPQLSCKDKAFDLCEKVSEGTGSVTYPTPTVLDAAACDEVVAAINGKDKNKISDAIKIEYVQVVGTLKVSGNYTNIYLDDYTANDCSAYMLPESFNAALMHEKKVTVRGYLSSVSGNSSPRHLTIVFTELIEGEADVPTIEYTDLSEINALAAGADFELTAIIAAKPKSGAVIVTDGTNCFYLYKPANETDLNVGDIVTASGKINVYNKLIESAQGPTVTVIESGEVPELTPVDITASYGTFLNQNQPAQLISATGSYVVDGTYTNLVVGENTIKGSLSNSAGNSILNASYDGKTVKVTGWYTGSNSSSKFIYTAVTNIEEVE